MHVLVNAISMNGAVRALRAAGLHAKADQTGGGCGTIFVPCATGKHSVMVGPFNYYTPSKPEHFDALSIGVEHSDPDCWGDGHLGATFNSERELVGKVALVVASRDPMALEADDVDAAYLSSLPVPRREEADTPALPLACEACGAGVREGDLFCESCDARNDRHADERGPLPYGCPDCGLPVHPSACALAARVARLESLLKSYLDTATHEHRDEWLRERCDPDARAALSIR